MNRFAVRKRVTTKPRIVGVIAKDFSYRIAKVEVRNHLSIIGISTFWDRLCELLHNLIQRQARKRPYSFASTEKGCTTKDIQRMIANLNLQEKANLIFRPVPSKVPVMVGNGHIWGAKTLSMAHRSTIGLDCFGRPC